MPCRYCLLPCSDDYWEEGYYAIDKIHDHRTLSDGSREYLIST